MAEGYVHIMLVGENITHVKMALQDSNDVCRKVKRLYLLHSPDESKKSGPKKNPTLFKKIATGLRDDLRRSYDFPINLISIDAFSADSIIDTIVDIISKEYPDRVVTKKHIVVNVTGGTNLMAVAAMIAAGSQQTGAYYILDKRFRKLESYVRTIEIPNFKNDLEMKEKYGQILFEINKSTFRWNYEVHPEIKLVLGKTRVRYRVLDSIVDTEWMHPKTKPGTIKETELQDIMQRKHGVPANTTTGRLKKLDELGMISRRKNCPMLTPEKGMFRNRYREYKINERDNLISIQPAGQSQLRTYKKV